MRPFLAASQAAAVAVTIIVAVIPAGAQTEARPALPAAVSTGAGYGDARQALLDAGWRPQPTAECASNMGAGLEKLCQTLPETEACSGDGYCNFHFQRDGGWLLTITTYGDYNRALDRGRNTGINIETLDMTRSRSE